MHRALSQRSQWSGFFSRASDVGRAVCEEVGDPPGLLLPLDFCSRDSGGGTPACAPRTEAGSWAVLAAESVSGVAALEGG